MPYMLKVMDHLTQNLIRIMPGRKTGGMLALTVLLTVLGADRALAHAQLIKSNPADKAELQQAPTRVDLWFNELLDEGFNSVEIIPAAELSARKHSNLAKGQTKVDTSDRTHLWVNLLALKPGKYFVQYRVLSRDGHTAPGRISFELLKAAKAVQ